jgi:hypothetical protein
MIVYILISLGVGVFASAELGLNFPIGEQIELRDHFTRNAFWIVFAISSISTAYCCWQEFDTVHSPLILWFFISIALNFFVYLLFAPRM